MEWSELPNSGVLFTNQFEEGDFTGWTGVAATPAVVNTQYHHGTYSQEVDAANEGAYKTFGSKYTTCYMRAWAKYTGTPSTYDVPMCVLYFREDSTRVATVSIRQNAASDYRVRLVYTYPSTTTVDSAAVTWATGEWHCFEAKLVLNDAANGEYRVWYDGVEVITVTSKNTSGSAGINHIRANGYQLAGTTPKQYMDCIVFSTAAIGVEDRHDLVDDDPANDDTGIRVTRFNAETVAYTTRRSIYNLTDHGAEVDAISDVTLYCRAKYSSGGGNETFNLIMKLDAAEITSEKTAGAAYAEFSFSSATDPGGGAWSWVDVDALEVGAAPTALDAGDAIDISEFWVIVTYAAAGAVNPKGSNLAATMTEMLNSKMLFNFCKPQLPKLVPRVLP